MRRQNCPRVPIQRMVVYVWNFEWLVYQSMKYLSFGEQIKRMQPFFTLPLDAFDD